MYFWAVPANEGAKLPKIMKILVVTRYIPRPDLSSGERRLQAILKALSSDHQVSLWTPVVRTGDSGKGDGDAVSALESMGILILPPGESTYDRLLQEVRYDAGFFEYFWMAEQYMGRFIRSMPEAAVIVDSVDLHFAREESHTDGSLASRWKRLNTRRRELLVYRTADITIAVSREDRDRMKREKGIRRICLVPNIVPSYPRANGLRGPEILFVGGFGWSPNVDAMRWFFSEIWPAVRRLHPEARMSVVGSNPPADLAALSGSNGIEVTGYVTDTSLWLDKAALSVAPLRFGGGMKGKVNEAFAHGVPVVATSIGAQGFDAAGGREMFIADDAESFASCIIRLLENPDLQESMGLAGQALNERLCSPAVVEKAIAEMAGLCRELPKKRSRIGLRLKLIALAFNRLMIRYHWAGLFRKS